MVLKANEYPDVWELSDEQPTPKNFPTWADVKDKGGMNYMQN